ncbi:BatA domain-containing protein [Chitinophaga flava]|nr:BatA domain-containing protein [Chitinophaga flava]
MLHLLQPIWMILTAGIAVPVLIHLWHRRPGRVLKISSVQLLAASSVRHARSWRLSEWWLLLLRCLLILLLALLLACPVWRKPITARNTKGWVITEKAVYPAFSQRIDSLMGAGFQLHTADTSFTLLQHPSALPPDTSALSYWQLLQMLPQKIPADLPVYLFTSNRLARFEGIKPDVALALHWYAATPADSVDNWNGYTYLTNNDSLRILKGHSTPAGTTWQIQDTLQQGDTTALYCTIYTDKYLADARYLEAALQAVQQYTRRKIKIQTIRQRDALPAKQDWLWWLSDSSLPANARAARIIRYASGTAQPLTAWIAGSAIPLYKRLPVKDTAAVLWKDSYGAPLLTQQTLYIHLDPSWSELVWSSEFPQRLLDLMFPAVPDKKHDRRMIDPQQLQQPSIQPAAKVASIPQQETSLENINWILLFLIFCMERYFSFKSNKKSV